MSVARRERAALVETILETGPEAPTLCEGWNTRDLAAHLVVREHRIDAGPGILIPFFAGHTEKVQNEVAANTEWNDLVGKIAAGPPKYSPFKLIDSVANVGEMFIHHEDVRRAAGDWEPRELEPDLVARLRRMLPLMGRLTLAKVPARLALRTTDGKTLLTAGRGPAVTVTGPPEELLLFAVGRKARVHLAGDEAAVQAVRDAPKGF
ncbi:TIGR03085 family protein [Mycobacterium asiaticum]|uniref:TIGR03085 family protein n=1 Tax=Mycobacterium asiaticum TaxID=1790 RepID=A0A1A3P0W2_MYCAS|nr:TIGR03085 family metal-binding protein [Mycobacterium asiaticum]OBK26904.1 TIGR03085 family protein [Mycobacterium asiaticum]